MKMILWLPFLFALAGCELLGIGRACSGISVPGISVNVVDSVTGGPIATGVSVIATDRAYGDTVRSGIARLAYDRPGTYTVEVTANGYSRWVQSAVVVRQDDEKCHVRTVDLVA